ncbi:Repressed by TUP1 protein 1, related [Eimeria mitis]|uniref:Repressed by TUP1 protein 1, related n=1 Tax=Eimeria mitis TaxID=44415 RepID=U6KCL1_9EIME|nr:Repressed by TUP1 protein 1, related [Eimeria mitis]CDJ33223.1 Repressed by TUP1 protein 1, related [Eimeria mitis]
MHFFCFLFSVLLLLLLLLRPDTAAAVAAGKGVQGLLSGVHTPQRAGRIHGVQQSAFITHSAAAAAAAAAAATAAATRAAANTATRAATAAAAAGGEAGEARAYPIWSLSDLPSFDSSLVSAAVAAADKHKVRDVVCFVRCAAWQRAAEEYEQERLLLQRKRGPLLSPLNKPVSQSRCFTPDYLYYNHTAGSTPHTIPATTPQHSTPQNSTPQNSIPEVTPQHSIPEVTPQNSIPENSIPQKKNPKNSIPAPHNSIPEVTPQNSIAEVTPQNSIPAPHNSIPEVTPQNSIPENSIPEKSIPEKSIPGKGMQKKSEDLLRAEWEAMIVATCLGPTHIDSVAETLIQDMIRGFGLGVYKGRDGRGSSGWVVLNFDRVY